MVRESDDSNNLVLCNSSSIVIVVPGVALLTHLCNQIVFPSVTRRNGTGYRTLQLSIQFVGLNLCNLMIVPKSNFMTNISAISIIFREVVDSYYTYPSPMATPKCFYWTHNFINLPAANVFGLWHKV